MRIDAMKLALAALEDVDGANQLGWWARSKAITAIKQALAAPAQERCEYCDGTGDVYDQTGEWRGTCHCMKAAQPAVPEGWKLVPVEPSDAMVQAAHHLDLSYMPGQEGADRAAIYRAMLAAAPEKGQQ
jgi:hypothetical protein